MKSLFQKQLRWLVALALTLCLGACAIGQDKRIEHGFVVQNEGEEKVTDVFIRYGEVQQKFCNPHCLPHRGGGGWFAYMPIQPEMQVSWKTVDGQQHQATVPVRSKVKDLQRLSSITLKFKGAQLEVQQWLHYSNPSILEFEKLNLYQ